MNIHTFLDNLAAITGGLYSDNYKFFREGVSGCSFEEVLSGIRMEFTPPDFEGEYIIPVNYKEENGYARYYLLRWKGGDYPTIIFHHGSGQHNYTSVIKRLFPERMTKEINLIGVSVPYNRNLKEYLYGIGSLERFVYLICSSVLITDSLGIWLRSMGNGKIISGGISLGGWITNLHFAYFGSLDEYRLIFSGAALDKLFNNSVYSKLVSRQVKSCCSGILQVLNFEDRFKMGDVKKVYPLLARYDQYAVFDHQKDVYRRENISVMESGHITGSMNLGILRKYMGKEIWYENFKNSFTG